MKGSRYISCLLFLLLGNTAIQAQRHYFIPYSVNEGLAQSQVRDIVQSDDGFLWIATVGGISRFDGINFETFNKSNGLINNLTNALYPGNGGTMVASCPGGLVLFNGSDLEDHRFEAPYENVLVNDLLLDEEQYILGSNGNGLLYFSNDNIFKRLDLGSNNRNFIRCLSWYGHQILAGTKDGLILIDERGSSSLLKDSISVNEIVVSDAGHWIATNGDGLFLFANDSLRQFTKADGLLNRYVRDVTIDHKGNPWILSKNSIQVLDRTTLSFSTIKAFDPEQTANMKVIYADSEHNIWVGTDGYGILRFTGDRFELFSTEDGLSSNIVMAIDQDADGAYYFATYGYGVVRQKGSEIDTIQNEQGLPNLTVWSLLPVGDEVWFGTSDGIQILSGDRVHPFEANDALPFPRVSNLSIDGLGRIWMATRDGIAVWKEGQLYLPPSLEQMELRDSKGILEHDGAIWITSNAGLVRFTPDGKAERITEQQGLPENYITCIARGTGRDLWLGSEEGLIHFNVETGAFSQFELSDKVSSNVINFIENERNVRLWLGTDNGLFQVDLKQFYTDGTFHLKSFNKYDGIISNECNQNASFVDQTGNVWFGTNGGLLKYNHGNGTQRTNSVIGVHVTDIQQNFESVFNTLDRNSPSHEANTFKYNESRLTFRFSAIHFTNPDKVEYSYRLNGLDQDWSPATRENYITYSSLPAGEYTFEVRGSVSAGAWVQSHAPFRFYVSPPFYLRWWFLLGTLTLFLALGWLVFLQVRRQERSKRQLLEIKNKARVLGLEQQTLNAHMNRHFIFNALNSIQYYINTEDRKQANQYLTNFASLVRKNLDSAQVDSIYLKDELERLELYINLEQMRFKDRFSFEINIEEGLELESIQVPSMILQPFVENSIMHGILPSDEHGSIRIEIKSHPAGIQLIVDDNGIGIETSVGSKNGTSQHVSNGMKITKQRIEIIAKAFNNAYGVNGPFELKDDKGNSLGTRVEITLPANFQKFKQMYEVKT